MKYADIIIDISHEKLDKTFQYRIPPELEAQVTVGTQVWIPFGNGNRKIRGYVVELSDHPKVDAAKIKEIAGLPKDSVTIETQLIALAAWMKRNYGSTMNQALKTVIPIKRREAAKEKKTLRLRLSEEEARRELTELLARKRHSAAKERLLRELMEKKAIPWDMVTGKLGISSSVIRDMEKSGILAIDFSREYRNPIRGLSVGREHLTMTDEQQAAVDAFCESYDQGKRETFLLAGVTGSGKTAVYMEMIDHVLAAGRQVIVLIPEIALTYQTVMRFYRRFGEQVSILNSRMSPGERFDQYERAKNGDIRIIVGPRSALFSPFPDLGLIVIDEEHEAAYKSETVPKYHARETAIARAKMCQAAVVLGSATPSVESYSRARSGVYHLLTLTRRVASQPLPECEIVDLREELRRGNRSMLSGRLQEEIALRLERGEQTMLFLNRRGMMGFLSCRACGHVIKCPHCDVSLSLHRNGRLRCHYCGYETQSPKVCPSCGSGYIGSFRAGTQKIEEIVKKRYPEARVLRMDTDTTKGKDGHQKILAAFANREADILVGTQMIVKGHDFPDVTLVGILAADLSLNAGDYRSAERTFQLLTQAAGRAGRGEKPGRVLIQTYQPDHYSIVAASHQNYMEFYQREIWYRQMMAYPPAAHMLVVQVTSPKEEDADQTATRLAQVVARQEEEYAVMGPTDAAIKKISDIYRKAIYIKAREYEKLTDLMQRLEESFSETVAGSQTHVWFDFDPMSGF